MVKVGDKVRLLISNRNFNAQMARIVNENPIRVVTDVRKGLRYYIKFNGYGGWSWCEDDGHWTTDLKPPKNKKIIW